MGSLSLIISQVSHRSSKMPKELMTLVLERDNLQQKWGLTIQGGADLALTAKIASVKRFSPADRAGLEKMDYVWTVNNNEVFKMTQKEITNEIVNSKLQLTLQVERGTFIVPSFDEIWPPAAGQLHHVWQTGHRDQSVQQPGGVLPRRHHRGDEGREDHPRPPRARRQDKGKHAEAQGADQPHGGSEAEGQQLRPQEERRPHGHQCSVTTNKKTFAILNFDQINTNSEK